jgi:hypothetical protein
MTSRRLKRAAKLVIAILALSIVAMIVQSVATDLIPFSSLWFKAAFLNGLLSTIVACILYRIFRG